MTHLELNAILYYADFLSLKERNHPVTDNCKYFFIHGYPINSAFIVNLGNAKSSEVHQVVTHVEKIMKLVKET